MAKEKKPRVTKDDLDAKFEALQARNRERREHKLTGEDVAQNWAQMKAARQAARDAARVPGQGAQRVSMGIGIALLVCSGVMSMSIANSGGRFEDATAYNTEQIAALRGELRELPGANEETAEQYAANLAEQLEVALTRAEEVATLQNGFAEILYEGNEAEGADGAPSTVFATAVEHRKELAPYFIDRALFVKEELAYAPGSVLPFAPDEIDPRFPWYVAYEPGSQGTVVVDPAQSGWALASVTASNSQGVFDATWLNTDAATGDLLAWATASYFVDPGAFGDLMVGRTTIGDRGTPLSETVGG